MIYDILEKFKKLYDKKGDELILGAYTLKDGLYVKINSNQSLEFFIMDNKNKIFKDLDENPNSKMEKWFKQRDYYSSYLNSNKALFDKKIHNVNYFSYFFKAENFDDVEKKIDAHFMILEKFVKFNDKKDKEILEDFKTYILDSNRQEDIKNKAKILKAKFDEIKNIAISKEIKNYVKIFFDEDLEKYKNESKIYLTLKIFNDNKYNFKSGEEICGLSNSNMGLNAKKPFLEHKNRKSILPFVLKNKDALMLKLFFDWLKFQPYRNEENKQINRYLDEKFFIQKMANNDEAIISEFDFIPVKEDDFNKRFKKITFKNYLKLPNIEDKENQNLENLENAIDKNFYDYQLKFNYFKKPDDIKIQENNLRTLFFITKDSMINYFKKFDDRTFWKNIKKYSNEFVKANLINKGVFKASEAMNLKLSLENYKGEHIMDIAKMQAKMNAKLENKDFSNLENEEFFFLAGQVIRYLLNQSEAKNKTGDMFEPFLNVKNTEKLKEKIVQIYKKYKHAINLNFSKFNNALSAIMAFKDTKKLKDYEDILLIGLLSDNLFYTKKNENQGE